MKKIVAALVLAAAAVLATPVAANAATTYVPASSVSVSGTPVPGGTVTVGIAAGSFTGGEPLGVSVTGAGSVTFASLAVHTVTESSTATAAGGASIAVKLPMDATGTYAIVATGQDSGNVATAALTVVPADTSGTGGSGSGSGGSGSGGSGSGSGGSGSGGSGSGGSGFGGSGSGSAAGGTGSGGSGSGVSSVSDPGTAAGTGSIATKTTANSGSALAFTGSTVPMLLVWAAGGAVILGGALVAVRGVVRRQRRNV